MKVGYFDCVGGASGDMLLGALVDAGAAETVIRSAVAALHLPECELRFERVMRGGLSALRAEVLTPGPSSARQLPDLLAILRASDLSGSLKGRVETVLRRLAGVEAQIHGVSVDSVHLHELGGDDTLADIVGVLAGVDDLGLERIHVSSIPLARGWTNSLHGRIPLPAPATLSLLTNVPIHPVDIEAELVTPTGAALLTALASGFGDFPSMTLRGVGSGAGRREFPFPNVVRLWVGETQPQADGVCIERLSVLETNLDDLNPQVYEHVVKRLFAAGALDVTITPMQMKKNRPGVLLTTLSPPAAAETLLSILFAETTTLGVRRSEVERISLFRTTATVETSFGPIRVKVSRWEGRTRIAPEYDDCRRAAEAHDMPLTDVMAAARAAAAGMLGNV